ncbi:MAG: MBL fold metallo-hydrolase [Oscillospiraceae bacterium]|nr:MBL fold metallo-hydrolase [Oscillospiraceae bacterium]
MQIKTLVLGRQIPTNCYVVIDANSKACAVIDPGDESSVILSFIEELGLTPHAVFLTHGHYDHTMAADDLVLEWGIPVYISEEEATTETRPDFYRYRAGPGTRYYKDGDQIQVGGLTFEVLTTPGHSRGSVCLRCENVLFTGDTLFRDDCGRMDLPGGSEAQMMESLKRIYHLEGIDEIYPGHEEHSTLERERRFNAYLRRAGGVG